MTASTIATASFLEIDSGPPTSMTALSGAIAVTTRWGEVLSGLTYGYQPERPGFFVFPIEPLERALNLERAYITRQAVSRVDFLPGYIRSGGSVPGR